jgi:hypothetical protein
VTDRPRRPIRPNFTSIPHLQWVLRCLGAVGSEMPSSRILRFKADMKVRVLHVVPHSDFNSLGEIERFALIHTQIVCR